MHGKDFQIIPPKIIEAWKSGEYYSGDVPSVSYEYLGVSLASRGWYVYEASNETETTLKGVAKIDFKDDSLFIGGLRLYTNKNTERAGLFWMSEFSHFLNANEVIWVYRIFDLANRSSVFENYLSEDSFETAQRNFAEPNFGLIAAEWNALLDRVRLHLYDDLEEVESECERTKGIVDKGLLHFFVKEGRAQYRQIYSPRHSGPLIGGEARYTKVYKL